MTKKPIGFGFGCCCFWFRVDLVCRFNGKSMLMTVCCINLFGLFFGTATNGTGTAVLIATNLVTSLPDPGSRWGIICVRTCNESE